MAADDFFARWSKRAQPEAEPVANPADGAADAGQPVAAEPPGLPAPTLEEASRLTADSDYARFVAPGVDEDVKRAAMKMLFSDPHFNRMDGLDTYIDDYSVFEPIPPDMLRALNHGKALLDPLAQLEQPLMELVQKMTGIDAAAPADAAPSLAPPASPPAALADAPLPSGIPTAAAATSDRGPT